MNRTENELGQRTKIGIFCLENERNPVSFPNFKCLKFERANYFVEIFGVEVHHSQLIETVTIENKKEILLDNPNLRVFRYDLGYTTRTFSPTLKQ